MVHRTIRLDFTRLDSVRSLTGRQRRRTHTRAVRRRCRRALKRRWPEE
ncbi:unnamed protein product [Soboliphyme baturini]|uniref:Uncharacterized protein n=1 Tax=Soboliphyme baturini TaxID=241478 RepID=A0A183J4C4_9BILA|nr:unnamed protein product [Soboliphyme baturini]